MRKLFLIIALVFITNCFASAVDDINSIKSEGIGTVIVSNFDSNIFSNVDGVELSNADMKEVKGEGFVSAGALAIVLGISAGQLAHSLGGNDTVVKTSFIFGAVIGIFIGFSIPGLW